MMGMLGSVTAATGWADDSAPAPVLAPSGVGMTLHEVLYEEQPYSGETLIVVRVVAPAITSPVLAATVQADMQWVCETWGLPASSRLSVPADQIVVELMAEPITRGEPAPDITQFFETYSPQDDVCIWELF